MSFIYASDPHPGRCQNMRRDKGAQYTVSYKRCLEMDGHQSACRFPPDSIPVYTSGFIHSNLPEPVPWVVPE